ncbi:MAG: plastocyanin/azurin family copper-binding protein [Actinomycetota bacterium]
MWKQNMILMALAGAVLLVAAACGELSETDGASVPLEKAPTVETLPEKAPTVETLPEKAPTVETLPEEAPTVEASGDYGRVIAIDMTEMAFAADSLKFSPGETVEFLITNSGVAEHEFRLTNQHRIDEHIADGHADDDHDDEADHDDGADDVVVVLNAGEIETLVFTFPDNDQDYTIIACLIPGHYEAGMATDLNYRA